MKTPQFAVTVSSGNRWYLQCHPEGIDVSSTDSSKSAAESQGVTVNRVEYFARGVFTMRPYNRWDPLAMSAWRVKRFGKPTPSARRKLQAEMIEAVAIFSRRYAAEMYHQFAKRMRIESDLARKSAADLLAGAQRDAEKQRERANAAQALSVDALKACGRELDARRNALAVDRPIRSVDVHA